MNQKLDTLLKNKFEQLDIKVQRMVIGGDLVDDLLTPIFVRDSGVAQPYLIFLLVALGI